MWLGDFDEDAMIDFKWSTFDGLGASITRATDGTISVYKANGTTQSVAGVTDTEDFDSLTGIHHCRIDTSADAFYAIGNDYQVVLSAATIDNQTVNAVIAHFSIENRGVAIAKAVWDRVLTGATHNLATSAGRRLRGIQEFQGYEGGAIWINTINGTAGTTDFENGTVENPVNSIADANTLAASLGIVRFQILPGSSITFAAAQNGQVFQGTGWTLALGGQQIVGTTIIGAVVSGVAAGTGADQNFVRCTMNSVSHIKDTHFFGCGFAGTQTVVEAGMFFLDSCHSHIAGTGTWTWDFGDAIGNTDLNMRSYSGGVTFESMGDTGTDTVSIEGWGQVVEGTCTGGTVVVRGHFTTSGITNLTLSDDARFDRSITISELAQGAPTNTPTLENATMYLYMALTNKLDITSGFKEYHNSSGTVTWKRALSDDGTTYSEAKGETGP